MKKYIIAFTTLVTLWSCQSDDQYEDYNRDPKNPTEVSSAYLFTAATSTLTENMASPNVNDGLYRFLSQYLTTTTYLDEPNYNLSARTNPDNVWSNIYQNVLYDLEDAKSILNENTELPEDEINARLGQIEVIQVYAWHVLVDTFGDIPYTEALQPEEITSPAYDDAATIYADLISRLSNASSLLASGNGYSTADLLYDGDTDSWIKFANSLKLRLGMRLSDINPTLASTTVSEAVTAGVFTSNDDNATLVFLNTYPNTNPLWDDFVRSGRSDFLASNTLVDYMNELEDPRRMVYFDDNVDGYIGGIYGGSNNFSNYTHIGDLLIEPTREGILLDYTEVSFNLSMAAQLGYISGSAGEYYNQAITASLNYWGVSNVEGYLENPMVAYDGTNEQFAKQYWIAMFDNPFQGWNVWKKYDAPSLNIPEEYGNDVPLRFTYPIDEQNLNNSNYVQASEAIGGDDTQTSIFWDVE